MKLPTIALVFPANFEYADAVISGIADFLERERTFTPVLMDYFGEHEDFPVQEIEQFDGIIGLGNQSSQLFHWAPGHGIPLINCGTDWLDTSEILSVYVEQKTAGGLALEHFHRLGLENVFYFSHQLADRPAAVNKATDFCTKATLANLKTEYFELPGRHVKHTPLRLVNVERETELIQLIKSLPKPCGIFCEDDSAGAFVCGAGLVADCLIPNEIAVLGYGNEMTGRFASVPISSFPTNGERVGGLAAKLMSQWLATGEQPAAPIAFDPLPIIVRESTGGNMRDIDLERIRREIDKHACTGLRIDELAEHAAVTRKTLAVRYEQAFGETPAEAIRRVRFQKARQLLSKPVLDNFSEVAEACGFASLTSFSNFFRRRAGESPAEYRKKQIGR